VLKWPRRGNRKKPTVQRLNDASAQLVCALEVVSDPEACGSLQAASPRDVEFSELIGDLGSRIQTRPPRSWWQRVNGDRSGYLAELINARALMRPKNGGRKPAGAGPNAALQ